MSEESKTKLILNKVVIVGKLKNPEDKTPIEITAAMKADPELLAKAIKEKFKFERETELVKAATEQGLQNGKFFHAQFSAFVNDSVIIKGREITKSTPTTVPGFDVIFQRQRRGIYDEIKTELIANRFEPLAGDPNCGSVVLTHYGVTGFWDNFPLGFKYHPHWYDPKQNGKLVPLMAVRKKPDGTYIREQAVSKTASHFVYEDEYDNIEVLRETIRENCAKYKLQEPTVNDSSKTIEDVKTVEKTVTEQQPEPEDV